MGDIVVINTDSIELMIKIFKKDYLDKNLFQALMKTKGIREFISHERAMGRYRSKINFKEEIKKLVENKDYEDRYGLYILKSNLRQVERDIQNIQEDWKSIIEETKRKVYKIVPKSMSISNNISLYWGGVDGGFTLNRREIFINYRRYFGNREEFIKILSHEMYHARKIFLKNKATFLIRMISKENRLLYKTIGRVIEEGLALTVQHGSDLEKDDVTETLTKRSLLLIKEEFQILNHLLREIKYGEGNVTHCSLNIYVIGYFIVSLIYKEKGIESLNYWTVDLNFRRFIKEYVEVCKGKQIPSNIQGDIVRWLLKERGI